MVPINPGRNFNLYQVEDGMKYLCSGISYSGRSSAYVSMKKLNNYKQWMHPKAPVSLKSQTEMYHLLFVCTLACLVIQKKYEHDSCSMSMTAAAEALNTHTVLGFWTVDN